MTSPEGGSRDSKKVTVGDWGVAENFWVTSPVTVGFFKKYNENIIRAKLHSVFNLTFMARTLSKEQNTHSPQRYTGLRYFVIRILCARVYFISLAFKIMLI